jgi:hypothetical protein
LAGGSGDARLLHDAFEGLAMRRRQRDFEVFSMSFLDTICCAFGAVILLLVLSKFGEPQALEQSREQMMARILELQQDLKELKGESEIINRDLKVRAEQLSEEKRRIARLSGDLSNIRGQYQASKQQADVANKLEGTLVSAQQTLTEEMKRLLGQGYRRKKDDSIGGIPVDSEYIVFIIDTSGSMVNYGWQMMIQKMQETLNIYPKVKGFQVMSDQGKYLFTGFRGKWIPDTPAQRNLVIDRLRTWEAFSISSPVEGINEAIRTYASQSEKISLYVLGDEFTGSSIDSAIKTVDFLNRDRKVRIHAIGFPVRRDAPQYTSFRFASLMRVMCQRNGGTFVGLDNPENLGFRLGR